MAGVFKDDPQFEQMLLRSYPMLIERVTISLIELPLKTPFQQSLGWMSTKQTVIVEVESDGIVGFGEAASHPEPTYLPEYTQATFEVLKRFFIPLVIGQKITEPADIRQILGRFYGHTFAKMGLESACWDLLTKLTGSSLVNLIGGIRSQVEIGKSIGIIENNETLLSQVKQRVAQGYKRIKLKVSPENALQVVSTVKEKFSDIPLMVDANSSFTIQHLNLLKELEQFDLMMIEQPFSFDDLIDHATLQKQISTPLCLDESIMSLEHARKAIQIGACKIINIKPGRVGGLAEARDIHDFCFERGIPVWCGGMFESTIGRYFNLCLATLEGFSFPADISQTNDLFSVDVTEDSFNIINGMVQVPTSLEDFGIHAELIEKLAVQRFELKR